MNTNKLGYWIIWLILVSSVICYRFLLGVENPKEEPLLTAPFFLSISMVLGSLVCRVLILPKIKNKLQTYIRRCNGRKPIINRNFSNALLSGPFHHTVRGSNVLLFTYIYSA